MQSAPLRGRFCWHELLTSDPKAAISYYTKVIGWKTELFDKDSGYTMWVGERGPLGGVMTLPPQAKAMNAPPHWLPYIMTLELDASVRDATRLGARVIMEPTDIPGAGRFSVLFDPQEAVFALYSSNKPVQGDVRAQLGEFSWHELATTDPVAAYDFYRALVGWEKTDSMDMGSMGVYQMFGWGDFSLGGIYRKPADMPAPPHWLSYILVPDAKKAVDAVKRAGGKVLNGPMDVPGDNVIAQCLDPQGAAFAVHAKVAAMKPAAAKKAPAKKKAEPRRATSRKKAGR